MSNDLKVRISLTGNTYRNITGIVTKTGLFTSKKTEDITLDDESHGSNFKERKLLSPPGQMTVMVLTAPDAALVDKIFIVPEKANIKALYKEIQKAAEALSARESEPSDLDAELKDEEGDSGDHMRSEEADGVDNPDEPTREDY